jgi:cell division protein FtsZ
MTLNLTLPQAQHTDFSPRITVIGVGGGGTNAVNNMIAMGLDGVDFVVANTDAQSLTHSKAERRVQLGPHLTQGLGAGAKPEIGRAAAEEATEELARHLDGSHMVFITAGMGGGTGTGAAPVIARMARERGVLTVGVVTRPFDFEGPKRRRCAELGIEELQSFVDTLIIIPNQNLFRMANERTTFVEAFRMADNVLYMGVRGVTDLMVNPGLVNLDFADIRTVMAEMGKAMMGTGESEGDDRAVKASEAAISNPLLEDASMRGARGVLINITGGLDMTLYEVDEAANRIRKEVDEEANIIFGTSMDETMNGRIRVSVVATGIDAAVPLHAADPAAGGKAEPALTILPGGRAAGPAAPVTTRPAAVGGAVPGAPTLGRRATTAGGGGTPGVMLRAAVSAGGAAPALAQGVAEEQAAAPTAQPAPTLGPVMVAAAAPDAGLAAGPPPVPRSAAAAPGGGFGNLFRRVTGAASSGLMRRQLPEESAGHIPAAGQRMEPPVAQGRPAAAPAARAPQQDEIGLDIPTFLRRQSN